jgi:TPR repeat protein
MKTKETKSQRNAQVMIRTEFVLDEWWGRADDQRAHAFFNPLRMASCRGFYPESSTFKLHMTLAEKGDAYGQLQMGLHYLKGDGVKNNPALAREYFAKSAAQGNEAAKYQLGKMAQSEKAP